MWGSISFAKFVRQKCREDGVKEVGFSSPRWAYCELTRALTGRYVAERGGVKVDLGSDVFSPSMRFQFVHETFNAHIPDLAAYVLDYAEDCDGDVIELGAGSGFTSCFLSRRVGPRRKYVAVEANERIAEELAKTRDLNQVEFRILHRAYAASTDTVELHLKDDFWASGIHPSLESGETVTVSAVSLAEIRDQCNIDEFILFSNMEGAEFDLLEAELELLGRKCPLAIIAFHEFAGDVDEHADRLRDADFTLLDTIGDFYVFENGSMA